jgi:DNA-directed RNA polymerase subunit RPC12/RpoP
VGKQIAEFDKDTDYTNEVVCPWCGHEHRDSWEMSEGATECRECGREFEISRYVAVTYCTSRI